MRIKLLYFALIAVFLCDLFFVYRNHISGRFFTKTLLMPLLGFIYVLEKKQIHRFATSRLNSFFIIGLVLSFLGDFFLLFDWGFLAGLGCFLAAHVFYILCFKNLNKTRVPSILLVLIGLYLFSLIYFLFPYLKEMKIPVIIYGIAISTMMYFSLKTSNTFLISGALLFVISDSLLSVNLFVQQTLIFNLLVMMSYVSAQFCLVKGMLQSTNS